MATPTNFNPGEPVFDMITGEPFITAEGELVEVAPGLRVDAGDGRELDGDDVSNSAFYRANLFLGESLRDQAIGVPYLQALGGSSAAIAAAYVVGEVSERTPGVAGIVGVTVQGIDPVTRVLSWQGVLLRQDGTEQAATFVSGG
jgi:hypothetical protein